METIEYKDSLKKSLPPGARVEIRDEEWIVRQCEYDNQIKSYVLKVEGVSGIVRGMNATYLSILDKVKEVNPVDVELEVDDSTQYNRSKLFTDLWLRKHIPSGPELVVGHKGVFNEENFQLIPTFHALDSKKHFRPRILLADAVGMGKTIQVGVLLSELIYRGRGQRILVVCLKSMMLQLQKELWSRFNIPLEALDSDKIQRTYAKIPSNMNPFNYYDRAIVSMDTLKSPKMMKYIDSSHWDVIVIDECHNVAKRGKTSSDRSRLARKLSSASDALILTSATPHDGTKESYASLLELLDPVLVVDPSKITKKDLDESQVVFRRFGKDVGLEKKIPKRNPVSVWAANDPIQDSVLTKLKDRVFSSFDKNKAKSKDIFLKTTLAKLSFSSTEAVMSTIEERLKKIEGDKNAIKDKEFLQEILAELKKLPLAKSPKYLSLVKILKEKEKKKERVVIFTEYRKTQDELVKLLAKEFGLKVSSEHFDDKAEVVSFHAGVPENKQTDIIESFASEKSKIKILVTTDIASEGVNLHFYCNNLIHFDVPWSFITLEQRNGRIHRYGQTKESNIYYLVYETKNKAIERFNEKWVVEKLLARANNVRDDLGDEALALGVFDPEKETELISVAVQDQVEKADDDIFASLMTDTDPMYGSVVPEDENKTVPKTQIPKVLSTEKFLAAACKELKFERTDEAGVHTVRNIDDSLKYAKASHKELLKELEIDDSDELKFSAKKEVIQAAIDSARKKAGEWPDTEFLWENNPYVSGLYRMIESRFQKNALPVVVWNSEKCHFKDYGFIVYGSIFSKRGRPIKSQVFFCTLDKGKVVFEDIKQGLDKIGFGDKQSPNSTDEKLKTKVLKSQKDLKEKLSLIIKQTDEKLVKEAWQESIVLGPILQEKKKKIEVWYSDKKDYLEGRFKAPQQKARLLQEQESIKKVRDKYIDYLKASLEVEDQNPYVRVVGMFLNSEVV